MKCNAAVNGMWGIEFGGRNGDDATDYVNLKLNDLEDLTGIRVNKVWAFFVTWRSGAHYCY